MSLLGQIRYLSHWVTDDQRGASLVEYALLVSLIAAVALIAVATFGTALSDEYATISNSIP